NIYVLNSGEYIRGSITVYPPLEDATGILNEAPIAAIAGGKTLLNIPTGIAVDTSGNIYVTNQRGGPVKRGSHKRGRITVYAAAGNGNIAPIRTIAGMRTGLAYPLSIALDAADNIYVGNFYAADNGGLPSITVYAAGSKGNATPTAIITGDSTDLDYLPNIALDSSGNLYAIGFFGINMYPAGSSGNVSPASTLGGADTLLTGPIGIVLDPDFRLYVLNSYGGPANRGTVTIYPPGSTGDVAPVSTVTSNFTGIYAGAGIALDASGNIYVANELDLGGGSISIYPAGSYATGPPIAKITGKSTGLSYPVGIAGDSIGNLAVINLNDTITLYPEGSTGDAPPSATINIASDANYYPGGIAIGSRGEIYLANEERRRCDRQFCGNVSVYRNGANGDITPSAVIAGPKTKLATPSAVALGPLGNIYVANRGPERCTSHCGCLPNGRGSVTVYAPDSNGNASPLSTIGGPSTRIGHPYGITLDSSGNIYVLNEPIFKYLYACFNTGLGSTNEPADSLADVNAIINDGAPILLVFAAGSHGNTPPIAAIGGPLTGLYGPSAIAIGPGNP
ncbi:MAG: SBBP repeat-containing protein, partial [Deltaproteobacteria bacterium]|nr:SBBP repeat-containing protein [Deltaproteobacteria bacterium]